MPLPSVGFALVGSASLVEGLSRGAGDVNVFMIITTLDTATGWTKTMRWEMPGGSSGEA